MTTDTEKSTLILYGTSWCPDVMFARRYLDRHGIEYEYLDIDADADAKKAILDISGADWLVPTITFSDGSILCNPSIKELANKLGHPKRRKIR